MENSKKLHDSEYRFSLIVWENEPVQSGELAKLCENQLGWKRTTTYTVLKKLCEKGVMKNENATVTSLIKKEDIQQLESKNILDKLFDNSLPQFITAFMGEEKLTPAQVRELHQLIDSYEEES